MRDTANAFIDMFTLDATDGVLRGLTFGAKDLFDVAGHITGCGSPDKAARRRRRRPRRRRWPPCSTPAVGWSARPAPMKSPTARWGSAPIMGPP